MTCDELQLELPWLVGGTADEGLRVAAARHLAGCPQCRAALAEECALRDALVERLAPAYAPEPGWARVAGAIYCGAGPTGELHWVPRMLGALGAPTLLVRVLEPALSDDPTAALRGWVGRITRSAALSPRETL